jgi:hypothetical protein
VKANWRQEQPETTDYRAVTPPAAGLCCSSWASCKAGITGRGALNAGDHAGGDPRVGFIVTNMSRPAERVVAFYNNRGTCEQWSKEGKGAIKWTRLS